LLIREGGRDLNRVLLQRAQASDVIEQASCFEVRGLAAVLRLARFALERTWPESSPPEDLVFPATTPPEWQASTIVISLSAILLTRRRGVGQIQRG
jgi:hypothetical protein